MTILWENILITMIAFALLYWLLDRYAFSKLFSIMEQRRELVVGQLDEAKKSREQAGVFIEEQKAALQAARQEAYEIIEQSKQTSNKQAVQILDQAKVESLRIKEEAVRDIQSEKSKAVEELRNEVGSVSVQIASKLLGKEVESDAQVQEQLVNQYFKEVGGRA